MMKKSMFNKGLFFFSIFIIFTLLVMIPHADAQFNPYYCPFGYFTPPAVSPLLSYPRTASVFATFPAPTLPTVPAVTIGGVGVTTLTPTTTITAVVPLTAITAPVPVVPTFTPVTLQAVVPAGTAIPLTPTLLLSVANLLNALAI